MAPTDDQSPGDQPDGPDDSVPEELESPPWRFAEQGVFRPTEDVPAEELETARGLSQLIAGAVMGQVGEPLSEEEHKKYDAELAVRRHQMAKAYEYMQTRFPHPRRCPWCGNTRYSVREPLGLDTLAGGVGGLSTFPLFPVICDICGYTVLFSAHPADAAGAPPAGTDGGVS